MDARIVWVDRSGSVEPVSLPAQDFATTRLAPDGRRTAFEVRGPTTEIVVFDFARGSVTALTSNTTGSQAPVWSPDGRRIAYRGTRNGYRNIWVKSVDGTSDEVQLTRGDDVQTPTSWSPDGKYLLYHESNAATGLDLWVLSVAGGKTEPLAKLPQGQSAAEWSPDGRWIAYSSGESGRPEIFVMPFPATGQRWPVSTEGGSEPLWSQDGRELFYRARGQLMAVDVRTSPGFSAGTPRLLFPDRFVESGTSVTGYSMTRDGSRFLFAERLQPDPPLTTVHVVMNWFAELRAAAAK
jgi:Tol biopolymer transport system component